VRVVPAVDFVSDDPTLLRIGPNPSTNDAELIAFRVGEYHPRRVTLPDIGP
jgi:hypothetical protein